MFNIETGYAEGIGCGLFGGMIGEWLPVGNGIQYSLKHLCQFTFKLWLIQLNAMTTLKEQILCKHQHLEAGIKLPSELI